MNARNPLRDHWALDPDVRFLNHGSFGACPTPVLEVQASLRERMEREPVRFLARDAWALLDQVREELASFVGVDAQDLVFVSNATEGVNSVLRSLELSTGDEILITDHGYNACNNAARFVADRAGASVTVAAIPFPIQSADEVVTAILERVTPKTRLAVIDHVTSPTGLVLPIAEIVTALSARGVDTIVDGAHAPGMLDFSITDIGCAYYTGNCHKWLCGPKAAAFLHVRRDLQPTVRPTVISHGANEAHEDRSRYLLEFDWVGTKDPSALLAVPAAIEFLGTLYPGGWAEHRRRNRDLALEGRRYLLEALGDPAPAPDEMIGSLASVLLPPSTAASRGSSAFEVDPLQTELFDRYRIEAPITPGGPTAPWGPRRLLRISAQAYNDPREYRALAEALGEICGSR